MILEATITCPFCGHHRSETMPTDYCLHFYEWTACRGMPGYEYPLMWGLLMFAVALRGGGPWSLDRKIGWQL